MVCLQVLLDLLLLPKDQELLCHHRMQVQLLLAKLLFFLFFFLNYWLKLFLTSVLLNWEAKVNLVLCWFADANIKRSLPDKVRAPAVFRCHRVTAISNGEAELAYQATVKISGHVFRGLLYDHGVDENNTLPCISQPNLESDTNQRNADSASTPTVPSNNACPTSTGWRLFGGMANLSRMIKTFFVSLRIISCVFLLSYLTCTYHECWIDLEPRDETLECQDLTWWNSQLQANSYGRFTPCRLLQNGFIIFLPRNFLAMSRRKFVML